MAADAVSDKFGGGQKKERLRDRIEGTQAEADRAVAKATSKVDRIKTRIAAVEDKLGNIGKSPALDELRSAARDAKAKVEEYSSKIAASNDRIAELKAKLAALKGKR